MSNRSTIMFRNFHIKKKKNELEKPEMLIWSCKTWFDNETNREAFRNTYPSIEITFEKRKNQKKNIQTHMHKKRDTSGVDSISFLQSGVHESRIYKPPNQRNSIPSEKIRGKILGKRKRPQKASRGGFWFQKDRKLNEGFSFYCLYLNAYITPIYLF